ncbi:MAG: ABC transporter permease [Spirochaetes bacterium]|nr:ABC transporter permease [Spirochaetota bacterium]
MKDFSTIASLAWRNIWRNRRRTLLTLLTTVAGCGMIIFNNALFNGATRAMVEDAVALNAGHLQICEKGFHENRTTDYAFTPSAELLTALEGMKKKGMISGVTPRIEASAMVSTGEITEGAVVQGVDVSSAKGVISIHEKILPGGRTLTPADTYAALLGDALAKNLGVSTGSRVNIISQGFDGSIASARLEVVGLVKSGNTALDQTLVLVPQSAADETFAMMGHVNSLVVRLSPDADTSAAAAALRNIAGPANLEVISWEKLIPEIVQFVVLDNIAGYIFSFILFVVVAFTVLNTVQMSVFERTKEFGVLLSIGTAPRRVFSIVMLESVFIALIGISLGIVLGLGVSAIVERHPFDYSQFAAEFAVWGVYTTVYPAKATAFNVVFTSALTFALAVLFSAIPARRAMNLKPVEAMRHL